MKCPKCDSTQTQTVKPKSLFSVQFRADRECRDCGVQWSPEPPRWVGVFSIVVALFLGFVAIVFFLSGLYDAIRAQMRWYVYVSIIGFATLFLKNVVLLLMYGVRVLRAEPEVEEPDTSSAAPTVGDAEADPEGDPS